MTARIIREIIDMWEECGNEEKARPIIDAYCKTKGLYPQPIHNAIKAGHLISLHSHIPTKQAIYSQLIKLLK